MKKISIYLLALATIAVAGCQRETDFVSPEKGKTEYARIHVSMSDAASQEEPDTKSVISVDDANTFVMAYMFAFDPQSGNVLKYENDLAGDEMKGKPIAVKTTVKDFSWVLPIQTPMDVWVLANPPQALQKTLDGMLSNSSLTKADLKSDEFVFRCESAETLKAYVENEDYLPMVGIVSGVTLTDYDSPLSVKLERLFAHYVLKINIDAFSQYDWTITSSFVRARNSNTELPYFREEGDENCYKVMKLDKSSSTGYSESVSYNMAGFRQTSSDKLSTVDEATPEDILSLNNRDDLGTSDEAHFFFLENCQGKPETIPSSWSDVRLLDDSVIGNCSFIEIGIAATKEGRNPQTFTYRIYLGQKDMKSDFDVKGNFTKRITLNLKPMSADGFAWLPNEDDLVNGKLMINAGQTKTVSFETTMEYNELVFSTDNDNISIDVPKSEFKLKTTNSGTPYPRRGIAKITAPATATDGIVTTITGGDLTRSISDSFDAEAINVDYYTPMAGGWQNIGLMETENDGLDKWFSEIKVTLDKNIDISKYEFTTKYYPRYSFNTGNNYDDASNYIGVCDIYFNRAVSDKENEYTIVVGPKNLDLPGADSHLLFPGYYQVTCKHPGDPTGQTCEASEHPNGDPDGKITTGSFAVKDGHIFCNISLNIPFYYSFECKLQKLERTSGWVVEGQVRPIVEFPTPYNYWYYKEKGELSTQEPEYRIADIRKFEHSSYGNLFNRLITALSHNWVMPNTVIDEFNSSEYGNIYCVGDDYLSYITLGYRESQNPTHNIIPNQTSSISRAYWIYSKVLTASQADDFINHFYDNYRPYVRKTSRSGTDANGNWVYGYTGIPCGTLNESLESKVGETSDCKWHNRETAKMSVYNINFYPDADYEVHFPLIFASIRKYSDRYSFTFSSNELASEGFPQITYNASSGTISTPIGDKKIEDVFSYISCYTPSSPYATLLYPAIKRQKIKIKLGTQNYCGTFYYMKNITKSDYHDPVSLRDYQTNDWLYNNYPYYFYGQFYTFRMDIEAEYTPFLLNESYFNLEIDKFVFNPTFITDLKAAGYADPSLFKQEVSIYEAPYERFD